MLIGTAGHIDHGKTTLVRALTGTDTDRLPEEKGYVTVACGKTPIAARSILSGVSSRRVSSARRQPI